MATRSVLMLVVVGALAAGCVAADEPDTASGEDAFAVNPMPVSTSILPAIENSGGQVDVCVGLIGFTPSKAQEASARMTALVKDTVGKWNALLAGNPLWTLSRPPEPRVDVYSGRCPTGLGTFTVNVWATAQGFKADHCTGTTTCAPGASPATHEIFLGPINRGTRVDTFEPRTMLHEYGHLLGLGDTYKTPGAYDFEGTQPPSIMNSQSRSLTEDDRRGLWVTLRELKTGVRSCDGFGAEVAMTARPWPTMMCDPRATAQQSHGSAQPDLEPRLPREGTWAYQGIDVSVAALRVRAVARRLGGYTLLLTDVRSGQPRSEGRYGCDVAGLCTAEGNPGYRLIIPSATSLRLMTPDMPAGIQADFASP